MTERKFWLWLYSTGELSIKKIDREAQKILSKASRYSVVSNSDDISGLLFGSMGWILLLIGMRSVKEFQIDKKCHLFCLQYILYEEIKMNFNKNKAQAALQKAQNLANDFNAEEAEAFAQKHQAAKWYEDFLLLYKMVTDKQFKINTSAYIAIAGALAYVVLPIDVIPDFIPGVGFIDDIFVVGFVMKSIATEIERYKAYVC